MSSSKKNLKIFCLLSNRATYARNIELLKKLNEKHKLTLLLTSSLLDKTNKELLGRIKDEFYTRDIPLGDYSGTLSSMNWEATRIGREVQKYLDMERPDCLLLIADRWELLPAAVSAAYLSIPIVHVQGGEVSGNIDNKVRNAVSMLADIHFPTTRNAENTLKTWGLDNVYNWGCPSIDYLRKAKIKPTHLGNYVICMFHPHTREIESAEEQVEIVVEAAKDFAKKRDLKLYVFAPNNDPGFKEVLYGLRHEQIIYNANEELFYRLLADCRVLIGNSSCGIREACYLNIPAVNVGDRQKGRVCGGNVLHSTFKELRGKIHMADALRVQAAINNDRLMYGNGYAASRIVRTMEKHLCNG